MDYNFRVIKSNRRKSYSVQVTDNGEVIIRVPYFFSEKDINGILNKHDKWIKNKINFLSEINRKQNKYLRIGDTVFYLGMKYKLIYKKDIKDFNFDNNFFFSSTDHDFIVRSLERFFREKGKVVLKERVDYYSRIYGLHYNKIKITGAKKRWGSCSIKKNLNFSWRLVMLPVEIIDYVVVHELSHLIEMNHSGKFWKHVERMMPDYRKRVIFLKKEGYKYSI